jgi:hypothetical protein
MLTWLIESQFLLPLKAFLEIPGPRILFFQLFHPRLQGRVPGFQLLVFQSIQALRQAVGAPLPRGCAQPALN